MCQTELTEKTFEITLSIVSAATFHIIKSMAKLYICWIQFPGATMLHSTLLLLDLPLCDQSTQESLTKNEWTEDKDRRASILIFLSVAAISITSRSHGKDKKGEVNVTNGKAPRSYNHQQVLGCVQGCLWGLSGQAGAPSITKVQEVLFCLRCIWMVLHLATPMPNTKKTEQS